MQTLSRFLLLFSALIASSFLAALQMIQLSVWDEQAARLAHLTSIRTSNIVARTAALMSASSFTMCSFLAACQITYKRMLHAVRKLALIECKKFEQIAFCRHSRLCFRPPSLQRRPTRHFRLSSSTHCLHCRRHCTTNCTGRRQRWRRRTTTRLEAAALFYL